MELDEVHVFASSMPCDFKEIAYAREAAFAGETKSDLLGRDRDDGIDFDLAFFEVVSPAGTNARTHPNANASRDRTTSHAIAQVFREQHSASLRANFPLQRGLAVLRLEVARQIGRASLLASARDGSLSELKLEN